MNEPTDSDLLREFAATGSDQPFACLVRRHLDLVYSVALRKTGGDAHLAADVAQGVFTDLARKAATLSGHAAPVGWLFTSTHFAAAKVVRSERRRRIRERSNQWQFRRDATGTWRRVIDESLVNKWMSMLAARGMLAGPASPTK